MKSGYERCSSDLRPWRTSSVEPAKNCLSCSDSTERGCDVVFINGTLQTVIQERILFLVRMVVGNLVWPNEIHLAQRNRERRRVKWKVSVKQSPFDSCDKYRICGRWSIVGRLESGWIQDGASGHFVWLGRFGQAFRGGGAKGAVGGPRQGRHEEVSLIRQQAPGRPR